MLMFSLLFDALWLLLSAIELFKFISTVVLLLWLCTALFIFVTSAMLWPMYCLWEMVFYFWNEQQTVPVIHSVCICLSITYTWPNFSTIFCDFSVDGWSGNSPSKKHKVKSKRCTLHNCYDFDVWKIKKLNPAAGWLKSLMNLIMYNDAIHSKKNLWGIDF